jgi:hypothetical protein
MKIGSVVVHKTFGEGTVTGFTANIVVRFADGKTRIIAPPFLTDTGEVRAIETKKSRTPRSLRIGALTGGIQPFVEYLKSSEAGTLLELEARNADIDAAIRKQYFALTGEELVEGKGYRVAPDSAGKQGSEGSVRFVAMHPLSYPREIRDILSPDGTGHINRIDFVWMLVKEGFRVTR